MTLFRIREIAPPGAWAGPAEDSVSLDYEDRHRRRAVLTTAKGRKLSLDLAAAVVLRHGAALILEDGGPVEIVALDEAVLEVRARDATALLRLAWHIGNRHLPARLEADRIVIRDDHVIAEMLRGLGAQVTKARGPFDPEGGAYDGPVRPHSHPHSGHGHG